MSADIERWSTWLEDRLVDRGWRPADLARAIPIDPSQVSRWRKGEDLPTREHALRLAAIFNWDPNDVLGMTGHERLPEDVAARARLAAELRQLRQNREADDERLRVIEQEVLLGLRTWVRFMGRMPADAVRWVHAESGGRRVPVLAEWIGTRSPEEFLVIESSGSCLLQSHGILDGDYVLLERLYGRTPRNGEAVLVRLGDDYTFKVWHQDGDQITLRDGTGQIVHRFSVAEDYETIGLFRRRWNP